jgi:hypothetical protein
MDHVLTVQEVAACQNTFVSNLSIVGAFATVSFPRSCKTAATIDRAQTLARSFIPDARVNFSLRAGCILGKHKMLSGVYA